MDNNICNPPKVNPWVPNTTYPSFTVGENIVDEFETINKKVAEIGGYIDEIVDALNTIKQKMGENTGSLQSLDDIMASLKAKKDDLITKNKELLSVCKLSVDYVIQNKQEKSSEADQISQTLNNVSLYEG